MSRNHINLAEPVRPTSVASKEPSRRGRALVVGAIVFIAVWGSGLATLGGPSQKISSDRGFFSRVRTFIIGGGVSGLRGEEAGRINILLLGMGGEGHDGPYLTDTMILASVNPATKRAGLLTIPRDLVANIPGYGYRKINNANAFGQAAGGNEAAMKLAREAVEHTFNQPVHYVVRLDFAGFDELIDAVGGITVNVERAFTDPQYPVEDGTDRTEILSFDAGAQHMNGATALKFVRSRHGTNGEGSDFARSRRQERVLTALRDKVLQSPLSPQYIASLYTALQKNIATDMGIGDMVRFFSLAKDFESYQLRSVALEDGPQGVLVGRLTSDGAFVLEPRGFDYGILRDLAANLLTDAAAIPNRPRVQVQNGTAISGAAAGAAEFLRGQGFEVVRVGNAARRDVPKTVIFDLKDGARASDLARLKVLLNAPALPLTPAVRGHLPTSTVESVSTVPQDVDFLVILGPDQQSQN